MNDRAKSLNLSGCSQNLGLLRVAEYLRALGALSVDLSEPEGTGIPLARASPSDAADRRAEFGFAVSLRLVLVL